MPKIPKKYRDDLSFDRLPGYVYDAIDEYARAYKLWSTQEDDDEIGEATQARVDLACRTLTNAILAYRNIRR